MAPSSCPSIDRLDSRAIRTAFEDKKGVSAFPPLNRVHRIGSAIVSNVRLWSMNHPKVGSTKMIRWKPHNGNRSIRAMYLVSFEI